MSILNELHTLVQKMNENPIHFQNEKEYIYQLNLKESGTHQIVFENGQVRIEEGTPYPAVVTLILSDDNFSKLLRDELNTLVAFMTGNLKVEGSVGFALKLQEIMKRYQ